MAAMSERVELRLDEKALEAIDAWRGKQDGVPARSEAIRRLIERGLRTGDSVASRFSPGDRLTVFMLCDMIKTLKLKTDIDPDFVENALASDYEWAFDWKYQGIFPKHVKTPPAVSFVVDVLDMWDFIESAHEKLSAKAKKELEEAAVPFGKNPAFSGFDGNYETEYMGIAAFMVGPLQRFSRFKKREFNSHIAMAERYRRMLDVFLPIRAKLMGRGLDQAELAQILSAPAQQLRKKE